MKNSSFFLRLAGWTLVITALIGYNQFARQPKEDSLETVPTTVKTQTESAAGGTYRDGTYRGQGNGFGGPITVSVTVENGQIAEVEILSADFEDPAYSSTAEADLPGMIVETQSTDLDTVGGATFTSRGILDAVNNALEGAVD